MNLYQATELARLEHFVNEDGEIDIDAFKESEVSLLEKQRAYIAYIKNLQIKEELLSKTIDDLEKKAKNISKKIDTLKNALADSMDFSGSKKIEAEDGSFYATRAGDSFSVDVSDDFVAPEKYLNPPKITQTVNKKLIAEDLKNGVKIDGCKLNLTKKLLIK